MKSSDSPAAAPATETACCTGSAPTSGYDIEQAVLDRYAGAAAAPEAALCCPIEGYNADYLKLIPQEILEKDYGCGDPTRHCRPGETVVDLGSGGGKHCYIIAQVVGESGRVIGVDFNDKMLSLARKYQPEMAEKLGYANVEFVKGRIQDLALPLDRVADFLLAHPASDVSGMLALEAECQRLRREEPLIADDTVDVVVSNCVLNLVRPEQKDQLFREIFRVLRKGGRAVISDIVCDELPTEAILNDPDLWSGCISGAFLEDDFLKRFEAAGFYGVEILARSEQPWQTIDGIEFRSMTIQAYKGKQGPCYERNQAVVYTGPWRQVVDDDGHTLYRGERMAVCDKTYSIMTDPHGPYARSVIGLEPRNIIPLDQAAPFDCRTDARRHPKVSKGHDYHATTDSPNSHCTDGGCC